MLLYNSLTNNDLTNLRQPTKDYVRNFNLFMQNEPKLYNPQTFLSPCSQSTYNNFFPSNLAKNEPKRTQNEPKVKIGKIEPNPLFKKGLYQFLPLSTYKNEPKRTQNKPNSKPTKSIIFSQTTTPPPSKKVQIFFRICLHLLTYGVILSHIVGDLALCN